MKRIVILLICVFGFFFVGCDDEKTNICSDGNHLDVIVNRVDEVQGDCLHKGHVTVITKCNECNEVLSSVTEETDFGPHIEGKIVEENVKEGSCSEMGEYEEVCYCLVCEQELSRVKKTTDYGKHLDTRVEIVDEVKGDCTTPRSYTEVTYCNDCNKELSRVNKVEETLGHNPGDVVVENVVLADCCNDGSYDEVTYCIDCFEIVSTNHVVVEASGHSEGLAVKENVVEGSCITNGSYDLVIRCSNCNEIMSKETITGEKGSHKHGDVLHVNEITGDCLHKGSYDEVVNCCLCGEEISRTTIETSLGGHRLGAPVKRNEVQATCLVDGSYELVTTCLVCNEEQVEVVSLGKGIHITGSTENLGSFEGTCQEEGYILYNDFCMFCYEMIKEYKVYTGFAPHDYNNVFEDNVILPTPISEGSYDLVCACTLCGDELYRHHQVLEITNQVFYSQYDYIELSSTVNNISEIVKQDDGSYLLVVKTNQGKTVRLMMNNPLVALDNGWAEIPANTQIVLLDALHGLNYIEYSFVDEPNGSLFFNNYYHLGGNDTISSIDEIYMSYGAHLSAVANDVELETYPNYFVLKSYGSEVKLESIKIYYNNVESRITDIDFYVDFTQPYVKGELYDETLEEDPIKFYLRALYTNEDHRYGTDQGNMRYAVYSVPCEYFEVGHIVDKEGIAHNRIGRRIETGDMLEVTVDDCEKKIPITIDTYEGDTLYETVTTTFIKTTGTQNILAIPIIFNDQLDRYNDTMLETMQKVFGNVLDNNGYTTTHSFNDKSNLSLSEFLKISSYDRFTTSTYITAPYYFNGSARDYYFGYWENTYLDDITQWLYSLNLDLTKFDQNNDGYFDCVILMPSFDFDDGDGGYSRVGMSGAFKQGMSYYDVNKGTSERPTFNSYINLPYSFMFKERVVGDYKSNPDTSVLIHEFGHYMGLGDYYDNDSNHNVVGTYDIMSSNEGDHNPYSKYALGWVNPVVVDEVVDSVEINIDMFSTTGDCILIPALGYDYNNTPFDEYIMIDLFANDNLYDASSEFYGLNNTVGVRIYHINSIYEKRTYQKVDGSLGIVATQHHTASIKSKFASQGKYIIELIQNGNVNTFQSDLDRKNVNASDYFYQGDVFKVDEYTNFFDGGKMDNGMNFGYVIEVKEINTSGDNCYAVIKISKAN